MPVQQFFEESKEQSQVKSTIVAKYFTVWAKVIIPSAKAGSRKIAYVDLFAGPGRYFDGTMSTPLLILERAIKDPDLREMLVTLFNDVDSNNTRSLEHAITMLPEVSTLKYKPRIFNQAVGAEIVAMFAQFKFVPTLFFIDPWGYKGLSLRLINSVIKDWGCECILFFNYNRINMGLHNPSVKAHMDALFGDQRADELRRDLVGLRPDQRELAIIEAMTGALQAFGGKYVLPFRFKNSEGTRTSHHLILITKHVRGYEIMKDIMARESSNVQQGVPTFEYNPASSNYPFLFELSRPLEELEKRLY